jgi:hypothetical protein
VSRRSRRHAPPISLFSFQDIITSVTGILILVTLLMSLELLVRAEVPDRAAEIQPDAAVLERTVQAMQDRLEVVQRDVRNATAVIETFAGASPLTAHRALEQLQAELREQQTNLVAQKSKLDRTNAELAACTDERQRVEVEAVASEGKATGMEAERGRLATSGDLVFLPGANSKLPIILECDADLVRVGTINADGTLLEAGSWPAAKAVEGLLAFARRRSRDRDYFVLFVRPGGVEVFHSVRTALEEAGFDLGWDAYPGGAALFPSRAGGK